MKFKVTVQRYDEDTEPSVNEVWPGQVYAQLVDGDAFDLGALIRQVNTRKRVRASRAKAKESA